MTDVTLTSARVALVGNPNSGKTALFNALTGSRQKVANYAGVTVERKEGHVTTAGGRSLSILDLPGTYSLRARSPDEAVTATRCWASWSARSAGRSGGRGRRHQPAPGAAADLELKAVGRPMVLALNMYDIAQRQGLRIDLEGLARELGCPIVTTVATRKRGIDELVAKVDALIGSGALGTANSWREPTAGEIRDAHREAQRILKAHVRPPERPDTLTGKVDGVLLHPVAGIAILLTVLFLMFQAVFTWATPLQDLIDAGFQWLGGQLTALLPHGLIASFLVDGLISGVGSVLVFLPQIMILFLFIILLEDFGYMARAAFLMDRIMGGAGLHGRALHPAALQLRLRHPGDHGDAGDRQ